jgi:hypothetical protein
MNFIFKKKIKLGGKCAIETTKPILQIKFPTIVNGNNKYNSKSKQSEQIFPRTSISRTSHIGQ